MSKDLRFLNLNSVSLCATINANTVVKNRFELNEEPIMIFRNAYLQAGRP
jgi:hypothetical protein